MHLKVALLIGDAVNVHGAITTLGCDVLVKWVPCDTLDVMIMFSNFMHAFAYSQEG